MFSNQKFVVLRSRCDRVFHHLFHFHNLIFSQYLFSRKEYVTRELREIFHRIFDSLSKLTLLLTLPYGQYDAWVEIFLQKILFHLKAIYVTRITRRNNRWTYSFLREVYVVSDHRTETSIAWWSQTSASNKTHTWKRNEVERMIIRRRSINGESLNLRACNLSVPWWIHDQSPTLRIKFIVDSEDGSNSPSVTRRNIFSRWVIIERHHLLDFWQIQKWNRWIM